MSARCVYAEECGRQAAPHLGFLQCCEECYQNLYEVERTNNNSSCNICGGDLLHRGMQCSQRLCPSNQTPIGNFESSSYDVMNEECTSRAINKRKVLPQMDTKELKNRKVAADEIWTCSILSPRYQQIC